jgi:hypothetical protein
MMGPGPGPGPNPVIIFSIKTKLIKIQFKTIINSLIKDFILGDHHRVLDQFECHQIWILMYIF